MSNLLDVEASRTRGMAAYVPEGVRTSIEDEDSPLFKTDDFRMWCMKVIPCTKRFVHDWTVCPFAHAGEKAVRRDPMVHGYTGIACPDMKKASNCIRGDRCPYAHNVFEYWLHPTRYRTQLCNDGPGCRRGICFFAHSLEELRVPACKPYVSPEALARASLEAIQQNPHPLGAQLTNALPLQHQMQHQRMAQTLNNQEGSARTQQQAVLAALSGHSALFDGPCGNHHHDATSFNHNSGAMHINGALPRLSVDYGSLPRWSDCPPLRSSAPFDPTVGRLSTDSGYNTNNSQHNPMATAYPVDNANRFSIPSDYYSTESTTPHRWSTGSQQSPVPHACDGSTPPAHETYESATPRRWSASPQRKSDSSSSAVATHGGGGGGGRWSDNGNGSGSEDASPEIDGDLAQSLASLKIAMTQHNAASSSASNHEVVINTLHQILMDAAMSSGNGPTGCGNGSDGVMGCGLPREQLAEYTLALTSAGLNMNVPSERNSESSGRLSLEVASVGSPPPSSSPPGTTPSFPSAVSAGTGIGTTGVSGSSCAAVTLAASSELFR